MSARSTLRSKKHEYATHRVNNISIISDMEEQVGTGDGWGDRESVICAKQKHRELGGLIDDIAIKLSALSGHNEKEFLSAYRVHMLEIQTELKDLREGVRADRTDGF